MMFKDLGLESLILKAIEKEGYETPSLIQEQAIPYILQGKDVLGCAQTGTGKTAAFALPLIQNLIKNSKNDNSGRKLRVLVLTPTRELAIQVRDNFRKYSIDTDLRCGVVLGGVNQRSQTEVLRRGIDILVATPGRLLDLVNQRHVKLNDIEAVVLDEADTLLDMGFIHDVKKIIGHIPTTRQTLLFSATMPKEVMHLANELLTNYVSVRVNSESPTVEKIGQSVYFVDKVNKTNLLLELLKDDSLKSILIFTRTKRGANKLGETLEKNRINTSIIHGNKSQGSRIAALEHFKSGRHRVLVATDIAARGIDIRELSHVINYEIPEQAETYIHRIGRTGRAGFSGTAISLCSNEERRNFSDIEKLINQIIDVVDNHNYPMQQIISLPKQNNSHSNKKWHNNNKSSNNGFKKKYNQSSDDKRNNFNRPKKSKWYKKINKYLAEVKQ